MEIQNNIQESYESMLKEVLKELPDRLDIIFEDRQGKKVFQILQML